MRSFPSMAESLEKELDRYEEEHDRKPLDRQESFLRPAFIQVFPGRARAKIKGEIEETEICLAKMVADSVRDKILWDSPDNKCSSLPEPFAVPPRKAPKPKGGGKLVRSVQAIIKHYSGATIEQVMLRELLEKVFGAMRSGDEIEIMQSHYPLCEAVRGAVLKHWTVDKSFFEAILRPADGYGDFWENFLRHGFLLRRLKLAEGQPQEAKDLEPLLIEVLKLRGHEPADFFGAAIDIQETWIAEARQRYPATEREGPPAAAKKPEEQRHKLGWRGTRSQLLDFFCFVSNPGADLPTAERYFACRASGDDKLPGSAIPLQTRLPTSHLRYAFKVAEDLALLQLGRHRDAELARVFLNRNGDELKVKSLGKKDVLTDVSERARRKIEAKLTQIKNAPTK